MGSIDRRLRELEGRAPLDPCPLCSGWFAVHLSGSLDALTRDGFPADEYQRAEYLERMEGQERNGGVCPACGKEPLEIRIPGMPRTV